MPEIFISHRTTDSDIADMLIDFLNSTGIESNKVFCSSLPGNDVKEKISEEVKSAIKESCVNIAILSADYNNSAYCLNEAGILWFQDSKTILIALPEILPKDMIGFLNNDYKIRRLDNDDDIASIRDEITDSVQKKDIRDAVLTREIRKLKKRYNDWIEKRKPTLNINPMNTFNNITTDDEKVVLFYMLSYNIRKVNKEDISKWLTEEEIYDINIENAFDLLSSIESGAVNEKTLELDINLFRKLSICSEQYSEKLKKFVGKHKKLSKVKFKNMWELEQFDDFDKLFIAYIIDERIVSFGDRWMAKGQIEDIKSWENKFNLESKLSLNYGKCLGKFINNKFVYEKSWTSHGNPREYSLHKSLREFFFDKNFPYYDELDIIKDDYYFDIPF